MPTFTPQTQIADAIAAAAALTERDGGFLFKYPMVRGALVPRHRTLPEPTAAYHLGTPPCPTRAYHSTPTTLTPHLGTPPAASSTRRWCVAPHPAPPHPPSAFLGILPRHPFLGTLPRHPTCFSKYPLIGGTILSLPEPT